MDIKLSYAAKTPKPHQNLMIFPLSLHLQRISHCHSIWFLYGPWGQKQTFSTMASSFEARHLMGKWSSIDIPWPLRCSWLQQLSSACSSKPRAQTEGKYQKTDYSALAKTTHLMLWSRWRRLTIFPCLSSQISAIWQCSCPTKETQNLSTKNIPLLLQTPSETVFGVVSFGGLNTFSEGIWSTRDRVITKLKHIF